MTLVAEIFIACIVLIGLLIISPPVRNRILAAMEDEPSGNKSSNGKNDTEGPDLL
ncbi:MAG: hypothetical protein JST26_03315 [Bacteroidetes bacterium]|nr:hypothetical protein [Bacteroidota bacterium]